MNGYPVCIDIERSVLGACLRSQGVMDATRGDIEDSDFSLDRNRIIWRAMVALYDSGKPVDRVAVMADLEARGERESAGGFTYVLDLDNGIPEGAPIGGWVERLREYSLRRRMIATAHSLELRAADETEPLDALLSGFSSAASELAQQTSDSRRPFSTADLIAREGVSALMVARRQGEIAFPFPRLNEALRGMGAGQMVILMAATAKGKTSMALQIAELAALQGHTPVIWTMEMSPRSLFRRMVTQVSGCWCGSHQMTFQERESQRGAIARLSDCPIYFDQSSRSVGAFLASLRQVRARTHNLGLAVVDYLQLIRGSGDRRSRAQEVSENSRALKLASVDMGIPFLVLSQVDRSSVKGEGKITLHSCKESGDIENDADVVLWIDGPDLSRDVETPISCHIGKQREGPAGFSIPMVFSPGSQTFAEVKHECTD